MFYYYFRIFAVIAGLGAEGEEAMEGTDVSAEGADGAEGVEGAVEAGDAPGACGAGNGTWWWGCNACRCVGGAPACSRLWCGLPDCLAPAALPCRTDEVINCCHIQIRIGCSV